MSSEKGKRNFTITHSSIGFSGGKYSANKSGSPLSAAHRAARVLFRMAKNDKSNPKWKKFESDEKIIKFTIRETTRGSDKDTYQYEAKLHNLKDKKVIKRGDVEYEVTTELAVRAAHYAPTPFGGADDI